MSVRMTERVCQLCEMAGGGAVRFALTLPEFIDDNFALALNLFLIKRLGQMSHAIRFHPESKLHRVDRHGREVCAVILLNEGVHPCRTRLFEWFKIGGGSRLRPGEHQMLAQMRKSGFALGLIA